MNVVFCMHKQVFAYTNKCLHMYMANYEGQCVVRLANIRYAVQTPGMGKTIAAILCSILLAIPFTVIFAPKAVHQSWKRDIKHVDEHARYMLCLQVLSAVWLQVHDDRTVLEFTEQNM